MKKYSGKIIDIHSHILPKVDDGSSSMEKSISILRGEVRCGVTDVILTPHFRKNFVKRATELKEIFNNFSAQIKKEGIPINLYLGQEIFYSSESKRLLEKGELLTLNDTKYVLLEFSFDVESEIEEAVYEIKRLGFIPIVAHLERYSYSTLDMAREIKELGGLIQVNTNSIKDKLFSPYRRRAIKFIKNGLVDFVASDIHYERVNCIDEVANKISAKFGKKVANKVFYENAKDIIAKE